MSTTQQQLVKKTWNQPEYYTAAAAASETDHPAFADIIPYTKNRTILEVGCGEGTKLAFLPARVKIGTDISRVGLSAAKARLRNLIEANSETLPLADNCIDTALSFFTLEHFTNPEAVINEMVRVTRPGGHLIFLAPNFGSPLGASPCFTGNRLIKLGVGFMKDFLPTSGEHLAWHAVTPISLSTGYEIDYDTTIEPYVRTLKKYLAARSCRILKASSEWRVPQENEKRIRKVCRILGEHNIYPFTYWGPHLLIIAEKRP